MRLDVIFLVAAFTYWSRFNPDAATKGAQTMATSRQTRCGRTEFQEGGMSRRPTTAHFLDLEK